MQSESCKECKFWNHSSYMRTVETTQGREENTFVECRRNPPNIIVGTYVPQDNGTLLGKVLTYWPRTSASTFCGEFKQRVKP